MNSERRVPVFPESGARSLDFSIANYGNDTNQVQSASNSYIPERTASASNVSDLPDPIVDAIFQVIPPAPVSFCEQTKFLHRFYDSQPDIEAIPLGRLREVSARVGLRIDEIDSWLKIEKGRRQGYESGRKKHTSSFQLPPSPTRTSTCVQCNTIGLCMRNNSFGPLPQLDSAKHFSHTLPLALPSENLVAPPKAKRGRPRKNHASRSSESLTPGAKRQKFSDKLPYLCPDCRICFADDRWSEHVRRNHFPDQIWICKQLDSATGATCFPKPFLRSGNFGTHLKTKHHLGNEEIVLLKRAYKLPVLNHFHQLCGFSGCSYRPFQNRNESIEHIRLHFKEVAQQVSPPVDMGASLWEHKCDCNHNLTPGVHYHEVQMEDGHDDDDDDDDDEDDDENNDDESGNGNSSNQQSDNSGLPPNSQPPPGQDDDSFDFNHFGDDYYLSFMQNSVGPNQEVLTSDIDAQNSTYTTYGLEQFLLPFTALRTLGVGGHGLVHEVVDKKSTAKFARKSVRRISKDPAVSSLLSQLKNELLILKALNHPHIVKAIGAYADSRYAHIIISPVADQNLANRLTQSIEQGQLVQWMASLASATSYLHANDIQHLDIKPENVLLKGEIVLLADFGTARYFTGMPAEVKDDLAVTPMYSAPETMLYRHQEYASDVFSLGCVFSEMITRYFGHSVEQFRKFRTDNGGEAFYLAILAVREWVALLPRYTQGSNADQRPCQYFDPQRQLHQNICQMLDNEPSTRPKASQLRFDFRDTGYCPEHGKVWVNVSSSSLGYQHSVERSSNSSINLISQSPFSKVNLSAEAPPEGSCELTQPGHGDVVHTTSYGVQNYLGNVLLSGQCSMPRECDSVLPEANTDVPIVSTSSNNASQRDDEWERLRLVIKRLYVDEDKTLKELISIMEQDHGHRASASMYKVQMKKWNLNKVSLTHPNLVDPVIGSVNPGSNSSASIQRATKDQSSVPTEFATHRQSHWADDSSSQFSQNTISRRNSVASSMSSFDENRKLHGDPLSSVSIPLSNVFIFAPRRAPCPIMGCATTFLRRADRDRHMKEKHGELEKCPVPGCNWQNSKRKGRLDEHMGKAHKTRSRYPIPIEVPTSNPIEWTQQQHQDATQSQYIPPTPSYTQQQAQQQRFHQPPVQQTIYAAVDTTQTEGYDYVGTHNDNYEEGSEDASGQYYGQNP